MELVDRHNTWATRWASRYVHVYLPVQVNTTLAKMMTNPQVRYVAVWFYWTQCDPCHQFSHTWFKLIKQKYDNATANAAQSSPMAWVAVEVNALKAATRSWFRVSVPRFPSVWIFRRTQDGLYQPVVPHEIPLTSDVRELWTTIHTLIRESRNGGSRAATNTTDEQKATRKGGVGELEWKPSFRLRFQYHYCESDVLSVEDKIAFTLLESFQRHQACIVETLPNQAVVAHTPVPNWMQAQAIELNRVRAQVEEQPDKPLTLPQQLLTVNWPLLVVTYQSSNSLTGLHEQTFTYQSHHVVEALKVLASILSLSA